jgi:murein tripeptide amidase MpaA
MKSVLLTIFFTLFFVYSSAQNFKQVKIHLNDISDIKTLIEAGIHSEHFFTDKDGSLTMFLDEKEFSLLSSLNFYYEILIDDWISYYNNLPVLSVAEKETFLQNSREEFGVEGFGFGSMGGFYTYQEVVNNLDSMFADFPGIITQKFSIGTTVEGRTIWAVKISDNPNVDEDEPAVGFDALIHAREPQSMATLMYFMFYLLENYGTDPAATYLINNREIYCVPIVNPDGYEHNRATNPSGGGMWRKNRKNNGGSFGVDLNRNYSFKWGYDNLGSSPNPPDEDYRGTGPFSELETQAIENFLAGKNIKTYLNMHSYQNAFLYPWGYIDQQTPDSLSYIEFASDMCRFNNFAHGVGGQVLGYNSNGSARDWLYGEQTIKNKIFGYTMEIGSSSDNFWPAQNRIFPIAQINLNALLYNTWVSGEYVELENANFSQQYFNPGDAVTLSPVLKNKGLSTGYNLSVELTSLDITATVNNSTSSVDSIEARSTRQVNSSLTFTISPAVSAEEEIRLLLTVKTGGTKMSEDTVKIIIGVPEYAFIDTTNDPIVLWTITSSPVTPRWESTTTSYYTSPVSYTDSKSGNYVSNATVTMTLSNALDLTGMTNPKLTYWTKYDIESNWDYGQVEISTNNGGSWTALSGKYTEPAAGSYQPAGQPVYDGTRLNWVREEINLSSYISNQVKIRFELKTDGNVVKDGWYIDDIGILRYTVIPVELNLFTGEVKGKRIMLRWRTGSERNNRGYEIEKRIGGEWENIGYREGRGTSSEEWEYSYEDTDPMPGKNYYRLKQIDYDGTINITKEIEVDYNPVKEYRLEQNYPNPFNPVTIIKYTIPQNERGNKEDVTLKVFDVLGNELAVLVNEKKEAGEYEVEFNPSSKLSSGVYFYMLKTDGFVQLRKMILMK